MDSLQRQVSKRLRKEENPRLRVNDVSLSQPNHRDHATESRRNKSQIVCERCLRHISSRQREQKGTMLNEKVESQVQASKIAAHNFDVKPMSANDRLRL